MTLDEILIEIYKKIANDYNKQSIDLIIKYDIRVENYFLVNILDSLECLKQDNCIKAFTVQYHVNNEDDRNHIDLILTDNNSNKYYIELKHFSISQKKTTRSLRFYTNNKNKGKEVGIIKDVEKLMKIKKAGTLPEMNNLICCAIITPKPTKADFKEMTERFKEFNETKNWTINIPIAFEIQKEHIGLFYLSKSF